jgi:hypothetical protein
MEVLASIFVAVPWLGSLAGFTIAVSMFAVLITLAIHAGLYYSVPRWILKALGQKALKQIS